MKTLPKKEIQRRDKEVAEKILSMDKCTWNTIPAAMTEIDDLRAIAASGHIR